MFTKPNDPVQTGVRGLLGKTRNWRELAASFLGVALIVAAGTMGLLFGVAAWHWLLTNPEIGLLFGLYVAAPLGALWIAVRIVRHAWLSQ